MTSQTKAVLSYVFAFVGGIVFLCVESNDKFVRLSAGQSTVFSAFCFVAAWLLSFLPIIGSLLSSLISSLFFITWIFLIIKSNQSIYLRLPFFSYISEKYLVKL